jgi:hypothetical protein
MGVKAAFIGAGGATLIHVLQWTLLAGHRATARKISDGHIEILVH